MTIRLMTQSDYDEVSILWKATRGMGLRSLDDSREGIAAFLECNPTTCFVSEENHTINGVILCGHDGRRGYIYHAAVDEFTRRRGIGAALVGAVLGELRRLKINKAALVAFKENQAGNAFWERLGFSSRDDLVYRDISLNDLNK